MHILEFENLIDLSDDVFEDCEEDILSKNVMVSCFFLNVLDLIVVFDN
jgi:hypothetical protein